MKRDKIPAYLLTIGMLLIMFVFGIATAITGGGKIGTAAISAVKATRGGAFDKIGSGIESVESEYNLAFFRKYDFVNITGAVRKLLGSSMLPSSDGLSNTLRLNDGLIASLRTRLDVEACRRPLAEMKGFLDERDIDLIFTYVHTKVIYPETQLPAGASDTSNQLADEFIDMLDDLGITRIDTREVLKASGLETTEMYFKTDAHWTIPAAFKVFEVLAETLNATGKVSIDSAITDINNYEVTTYESKYLGSDGRDAGATYAGLDDFTTIIPSFDTSLTERVVTTEGVWTQREGTFEEAVLHMEMLADEEGQNYCLNCYSVYGFNRPEILITNNNVDGGRVLYIKNSSGNPLMDFTALGVGEVCGLDWRVLTTSTMADYIDAYQPDAVVVVYNYDFLKPDRLDIFNINPNPGLN